MIEIMYAESNLDACGVEGGPREVYIVKNTIRDGGSTALYTAYTALLTLFTLLTVGKTNPN